ncbi:MAG: sugar ABC transporter permease [Candidatus Izemoplasmatales bacterium]|jgi:arabinogalactan oligomer/maltooligosaccharide transport system permease protein|nr:sugar ABC transporter permease [Candidatus Izemoplasmatales bacterium]
MKKFTGFFKNIGLGISRWVVNLIKRFMDGSIGTKLSHFIFGIGNLLHGQIIKGIIFLIIQGGFLTLFILSPEVNNTPIGFKSLKNLITLGDEAGGLFSPTDNSMLMLLFGVIVIALIFMYLAVLFASIKSSYKADLDKREGKKPTSFKEDIASLLDDRFHVALLTPAILGIVVFTVLPTIFMILIAFTNFDKLHNPPGQFLIDWVGFKNFADIFRGQGEIANRFGPVLTWTFIWAFFATATNYIGGILLALLINKKEIKMKKLWRTVFVLTIALPQFITLLAMRSLLRLDGPINAMLVNFGLVDAPIEFLALASSPWIARGMVILINIWIGVPYTMLMTSGILMNVPSDLYEAAQIDGATKRQAFFHITIPYILFVTTPYLITSFIGNITSFNVIFLLTNGGPVVPGWQAGETDLLVTWLYKLTIEQSDYNIGAVVSILTFIITATATLLSYRRSKAFKEEDAFQ